MALSTGNKGGPDFVGSESGFKPTPGAEGTAPPALADARRIVTPRVRRGACTVGPENRVAAVSICVIDDGPYA